MSAIEQGGPLGALPPPRRGRPRRADADAAILGATIELLREQGVAGLSMDVLAQRAGVGSAVNDTTRQMGGALGVAVIGSVVSSVYAANVSDIAGRFGVTGTDLSESRASLGGALGVSEGLGEQAEGYAVAVKDGFVDALGSGLRISALVVLLAAFVAWRFLPARARDPLAVEAQDDTPAVGFDDVAPSPAVGD